MPLHERLSSIPKKFRPYFWDQPDTDTGPFKYMFAFRRIWKWAVLLTSGASLLPLIIITAIDYNVTQKSNESEILLRTSRVVSNTKRSISFFLAERKSALEFIVHDNTFEELNDAENLATILKNLKDAFGGFGDIGVIDASGRQQTYFGPYKLHGADYSEQPWFKKVLDTGVYISDVFLGFRHTPHMVIAIKHDLPDGSFYVLRATVDTERFNEQLSGLELSGRGQAFIVNSQGILQTPSRDHGGVLEKISIPVPEYSSKTRVIALDQPKGESKIIGYAYIADTPFILMIVKQKGELMAPWRRTRVKLIGFLAISVIVILVVILGFATYLVNTMHLVDQKRIMTLHRAEYANKLASIGRLAAGVAHEINNPLAIINEKAGLIKDFFTIKKQYGDDPLLIGLVDSIIFSVNRCGTITRRLLSFARHVDVSIAPVDLKDVIHEVLGFLVKEAEYRCIDIRVEVSEDIPEFESDRGKLQQIFLNLVNNAFAALSDGGRLDITARMEKGSKVRVIVEDNGCGISEENLKHIFEPFYSTRTKKGGTGLGLSITYGLVKEIGGWIDVTSVEGTGTEFHVIIPLVSKEKGRNQDEGTIGGRRDRVCLNPGRASLSQGN